MRRMIATAIATPMVMAWWIVIVVAPRSIGGRVAKKFAIGRLTPGFQISWARPIMNSSNEIETHELHGLGGVLQPPHDHGFEQHAEERGQDQQHHDEGDRGRPAPVEAQLPVGEREEHPGRAVGEVEDAGGRVRQHQAAGDHGEDRRDRQTDDREGQELIHGLPVGPVAARCGLRGSVSRSSPSLRLLDVRLLESGYLKSAMLSPTSSSVTPVPGFFSL